MPHSPRSRCRSWEWSSEAGLRLPGRAVKTVALQILVLITAAFLAGLASNSVRQTLEWRGNDPQFLKHDIVGVTADEAARLQHDPKTLFLDVRPAAEFVAGHIPGAVPFPSEDMDSAYAELRDFFGPDVMAIVYGDGSMPAVRAAEYLQARDHNVQALEGGWDGWKKRGLPVEGSAP